MSSYEFTLLQVAEVGATAAKSATRGADDAISWKPYDNVTRWWMRPSTATDNEAMSRKLRLFSSRPELMIVAGAPIAGLDLSRPQLRRSNNPDASTNTLTNELRSWMALDFDDVTVPEPMGDANQLPQAAEFIRDNLLPPEFRGKEIIVTATSSTGLKGLGVARMRLFCLIDHEHELERLRQWAKAAQISGVSVDPAVLLPAQPIYTARPVFKNMDDPVPPQFHAFVLPGPFGDLVPLVVDRYDVQATVVVHRLRQVELDCGGDWRKLLERTLGGPEGFHEPLKRGIGLAARSTAAEREVAGFVTALLASRADRAPAILWPRLGAQDFQELS